MFIALRSLTALLLLSTGLLASEGWIADYDEAVKIAKAEKKDLFVDFTGSDWCGWCKKLDKEVFAHEAFLTAAKKDYVLVALDFPHAEEIIAKVPNPKRNQELNAQFGVQGYPTILLITADGEVYGKTGYQAGGPEKYVEHMNVLRTKGKKELGESRTLIDAWKNAAADGKWAAWDKIVAALEAAGEESIVARAYLPAVRAALEEDKDNKLGKKKRAVTALLKTGNGDDAVMAAGKELDPKNADGLLEIVIQGQFRSVQNDGDARAALTDFDALIALGGLKDKKIEFELMFTAAFWCANPLEDKARAKTYAEKAKAVGGGAPQQMEMLEQILAD